MPGYTGHIKEPYLEDTNRPGAPPGGKKQIPGKPLDNKAMPAMCQPSSLRTSSARPTASAPMLAPPATMIKVSTSLPNKSSDPSMGRNSRTKPRFSTRLLPKWSASTNKQTCTSDLWIQPSPTDSGVRRTETRLLTKSTLTRTLRPSLGFLARRSCLLVGQLPSPWRAPQSNSMACRQRRLWSTSTLSQATQECHVEWERITSSE